MKHLALLLLALFSAGCTLDGFLFSPRPIEGGYRWDEVDENLDGELTDPHPSLVPPERRMEGMLEAGGEQIHWVFAQNEAPRATLLYSHGTSRNVGRYWDRVELLWGLGYSVLIYDYPGYGLSTGSPDEAGVFAAAQAALEHLVTLPGVDPDAVFVMGYSLGGGPTYELAARAGRGEAPAIAGVISESTFCSADALVQDGSFLDLSGSFLVNARFDNCARIAELDVPVLIIHGRADDFVVFRHAEMLEAAARTPPSTLFVEGADHSDVPLVAGDAYAEAITAFLP